MLVTNTKKIKQYYQALLERNECFIGIFFVAVKTTSVFCISTCRARKPKFENVEFYSNFKDPLDNGYRPCKICKPTKNANKAPDEVVKAIELVKQNPKEKISDQRLKQLNISPVGVRRWFNKNYGMTFQSYQRMYRINSAFQDLKHGKNTTLTAFDAGYDSLSGFGYTFKKIVGESPMKSAHTNVIQISRLTTPLGPMFICASEDGVCLLEFTDRKELESELSDLQRLLKANIVSGPNRHIQQAKNELKEYFEGTRMQFDVNVDIPGTEFQTIVWKALQEIEYGTTSSYQVQASRINKPTAVRAVASANGSNRISIIIPCHRVIGKKGSMTGYGGGIERKKWLLKHEMKNCNSPIAQQSSLFQQI